MAEYILVGGMSILGKDKEGNLKLLTSPMGTPESLEAKGAEALKGGAPRVISNDLDKGFEYIDVEGMDPGEISKLRQQAEDMTKQPDGTGGVLTHTTDKRYSEKISRFIDVLKKIKGQVGGKLPGVLGILDIMGMKKEYDQIMAGEHPMFQEAKPITLKDGGYVTNPFVKDIFDN